MTTLHALNRAQERTGYNRDTSERFILNAGKRGKPADAFSSREREYLLNKEARYGHYTVVYNNFCFIYSEDCGDCITVLEIPKWFGRKQQYDGKQQIRNAKRYIRYNYKYDQEDILGEEWT